MNLSNFITYVPKAALVLLIIVTVFIAIEIYSMVGKKLPKKKPKTKKEEDPKNMRPLKFPEVTGPKVKKSTVSTPSISKSHIFIGVAITTVILIAGGGYYAYLNRSSLENIFSNFYFLYDEPAAPKGGASPRVPTNTPEVTRIYNPRIILYHETLDNQWEQINEEELSSLKAGDEVRIAVRTDIPPQRVEIYVNTIMLELALNTTPQGEPYALYTIPPDESEYNVAVRVF